MHVCNMWLNFGYWLGNFECLLSFGSLDQVSRQKPAEQKSDQVRWNVKRSNGKKTIGDEDPLNFLIDMRKI